MSKPYGVQLYTLREELSLDCAGLFADLARLGFTEVEGTADLPMGVSAVRGLLDRFGLKMPLQHILLEDLEVNFKTHLQNARTLGVHTLVVPWVQPEQHRTLQQARNLARRLKSMGQQLRTAGLRLGYHHHDFELSPLADQPDLTLLDVILQETTPEELGLELDVFWLWYAGKSPTVELERHRDRLLAVHLKDGRALAQGAHFTELGLGDLSLAPIVALCDRLGVRHQFIEQDHCERPALLSVEISLQWLRALSGGVQVAF